MNQANQDYFNTRVFLFRWAHGGQEIHGGQLVFFRKMSVGKKVCLVGENAKFSPPSADKFTFGEYFFAKIKISACGGLKPRWAHGGQSSEIKSAHQPTEKKTLDMLAAPGCRI